VFLAIVTAALLAVTVALPEDLTASWRTTSWRPVTVAEVQGKYGLSTGAGTLDLTGVRLAKGQTLRTQAQVGAGRLKVIVPADAVVRMSIDVGVGDIRLPGDDKKDVNVQAGRHKEVALAPAKGHKDTGTFEIDVQVGAGQAEVSRAAS
jgi:hypothetical protein